MSDNTPANENARSVTIAEVAAAAGMSEDEILRRLAEILQRRGMVCDE